MQTQEDNSPEEKGPSDLVEVFRHAVRSILLANALHALRGSRLPKSKGVVFPPAGSVIVPKLGLSPVDIDLQKEKVYLTKTINAMFDTDQNAAYIAKVREIAKILAKSIHGYAHETSPPEVQEEDIDYHIPSARVMVAKMAEEIIVYAFQSVEQYKATEPNGGYLTRHLIERGLIPAKPENDA
jgi:hypothetical protein